MNSEAGTMVIEGVSGGARGVVLFLFLNRIHLVPSKSSST